MTPNEYLDAFRDSLTPATDYEAAKRLELPQQRLTDIRKGRRPLTPYLATKIAIALDLDPITVIAEVEAQTEKDEKRREFWRSFLRRAAMVAAVMCTLGWNYSVGLENGPIPNGGAALAVISSALVGYLYRLMRSHNVYYVK